VASDGKAKRVPSNQFPKQGRYGQGVIAWRLPRTVQLVGVAAGKGTTRVTILLDKLSPKAMRLDEAPLQTRAASGKPVVDLKAGYQVVGLSIPWAVPRAVEGEKAIPEKEIEVPEESEEPQAPEVEQLTFGMIEPAVNVTPPVEKPKTRKPSSAGKQKSSKKPAQRKVHAVKAEQAMLITKPTPAPKKAPAAKRGRPKSAKRSVTKPAPTIKRTKKSAVKPAASKPAAKKPRKTRAASVAKTAKPANKKPASKKPAARKPKTGKTSPAKPAAKTPKPKSAGRPKRK
jgi:DNA gyrase C-terminal domain, beta-propeller